jgi:hypothetical protein
MAEEKSSESQCVTIPCRDTSRRNKGVINEVPTFLARSRRNKFRYLQIMFCLHSQKFLALFRVRDLLNGKPTSRKWSSSESLSCHAPQGAYERPGLTFSKTMPSQRKAFTPSHDGSLFPPDTAAADDKLGESVRYENVQTHPYLPHHTYSIIRCEVKCTPFKAKRKEVESTKHQK